MRPQEPEAEAALRPSGFYFFIPESTQTIGQDKLSPNPVIVPMLPRHISAVARMERECHPSPWSRKAFEEELTLSQSHTFVALDMAHGAGRPREESSLFSALSTLHGLFFEQIVGYICFWCIADEIQILNVTVAPSHRRRGMGRRLLHHALNRGIGQGARVAVLEVRKTNEAAQRLYEEAGFRTVGERPGYYPGQEPALLMQRDLDENSLFS